MSPISESCLSDHQLKCGMLDDMLDVLDLEEKRSGDEVQVGGFDLVFNGNHVKPSRPTRYR